MANPILHIKDSYYFEVPKSLWNASYSGLDGDQPFPDWLVKLDEHFLNWQAKRLLDGSHDLGLDLPDADSLMHDYHHWVHADHDNIGKPIQTYLEAQANLPETDGKPVWATTMAGKLTDSKWAKSWSKAIETSSSVAEYRENADAQKVWNEQKTDGYSHSLSGKVLIPQPFGTLNNLYSSASGFCISKFMVIQVVVALFVAWALMSYAKKLRSAGGNATKGRFANMLESFLVFIRDEVARPAIGHDADQYVPLLWSIFFFVLGMNLMGMLPWMGAPTGAFGCTVGMALVTLMTGVFMGSQKFGAVGFWTNQVPSMDLPKALNLPIKGLLFVIEVLGLFIKHGVLAIRLLANMFAGHIVLLGIMGIAFSVQGAMNSGWWIAAPISVIASTLFSVLEFGVAFLQAYIFTFLSALFIGAATHHH